MNEPSQNQKGWRIFRRLLIGATVLATLVAIFYTEENWRGKRAWENCKHELEAKGMVLDWDKFIPPPVPDDQNFFAAPKMQGWFVKSQSALTNDLTIRLRNPDTQTTNLNETAAIKYLAWSDQFQPDFDLIRQSLKRSYARMAGDYTKPSGIPIPNFVAVRIVAQVLAQRARCHLLLNQPEEALNDLTLMHDMCRLLEGAPTRKPMTLVAAMINVAVTGLHADVVGEGLRSGKWHETQLAALQKQLGEVDLVPFVSGAFEFEPVAALQGFQTIQPSKLFALATVVIGPHKKPSLWDRIRSLNTRLWDLLPRGWIYQNMASHLRLSQKISASLFDERQWAAPKNTDRVWKQVEAKMEHPGLFNLFSSVAIPNYRKAAQTLAFNQNKANEAQIACALERYRLAHGEYPETPDVLMPSFIEKIPHDIIGGQALHYRRTDDGKFLLYSVGWNETDDGGSPGTLADAENGDWVWQYP